MGINFPAILFGAVKFGAGIYRLFSGGKVGSIVDVLPLALPKLLEAVTAAIDQQKLTTQEQIDAWIGTADKLTGQDPGALDLVRGLPADKEEILFDAILTAVKVVAYNRVGVPGYVEAGA